MLTFPHHVEGKYKSENVAVIFKERKSRTTSK